MALPPHIGGHNAPGGGGGGSSTLSGLTDVDISNPTNGQTLVYNATSGKWENGGSSGVLVIHLGEMGVMDKTWQEIHDALAAGVVMVFTYSPFGNGEIYMAFINTAYPDVDMYGVTAISAQGTVPTILIAGCASANDYPMFMD